MKEKCRKYFIFYGIYTQAFYGFTVFLFAIVEVCVVLAWTTTDAPCPHSGNAYALRVHFSTVRLTDREVKGLVRCLTPAGTVNISPGFNSYRAVSSSTSKTPENDEHFVRVRMEMPEKWRIHHTKVNRVIVHRRQDLIAISRFSLLCH